MDRKIPSPTQADVIVDESIEALREEARGFADASKADATRKAYASDWAQFVAFANRIHQQPLPASADTVALFLTHSARGLKTSSLERRLASVGHYHREAGFPNPAADRSVRTLWDGIRREKGSAKKRKSPALTKLVRKMMAVLPETKLGIRDRVILLVGYAGGFRRSEICAIDFEHVEFVEEGIIVTQPKSKTDQMGRGREIGIPFGTYDHTCPVLAMKRWIEVSGISRGPVFRAVNRHGQVQAGRLTDQTVAAIVKRTLTAAGLDPTNFAGHSLRSGFATMASLGGATEPEIQKQTGHKNLVVLRRYIHDGQLFQNNAAKKLGL